MTAPPTVQPVAQSKQQVAVKAVAGQPVSPASASQELLSPSMAAILKAFEERGGDDKEMLKLLLQAKAKEDEVRSAFSLLRHRRCSSRSLYFSLAISTATRRSRHPPR
jgi:hypothetical protein